jgi:hypothetical protein
MSLLCKIFGHAKLTVLGKQVRDYKREHWVDERLPIMLGKMTLSGQETVYHLQCERCGLVFDKIVSGAIERESLNPS